MSQPSQSRQTIDVKLREPGTVETVKWCVIEIEKKEKSSCTFVDANPFNTEERDALSLHSTWLLVLETCTIYIYY